MLLLGLIGMKEWYTMKTAKNILSAMLALLVLAMGAQFPAFAQEDGSEIAITSSAQLIEEIGSGKTLVLADGIYIINETLEIFNIENLTVKAANSGKAEILSTDGYNSVVTIANSKGINLEGLILGHESFKNGCASGLYSSGYVVMASASENVTVRSCDLYGCGTVGTVILGVKGFLAENCVIRDCREYVVKCADYDTITSENVVFENCVISGNAYDQDYAQTCPAVDASSPVTFNNCRFLNNKSTAFTNGENVTVTDCVFENNAWDGKTPGDYGICLNGITWRIEAVSYDEYILCLGFPLEIGGTTVESAVGEVLPYSTYSMPWRDYAEDEIVQIKAAEGIIYNMAGECGENLTYELSTADGRLTIKGSGIMNGLVPWSGYRRIIKTVEIGEGVTSIHSDAFYNCLNLKKAILPKGLEEIGDDAFESCSVLKSIKLPENLKIIGAEAFANCQSLEEITVPKNVSEIGRLAFDNCYALKAINVYEENAAYVSIDGVLFDKNVKTLIKYPSAKAGGNYVTPSTVETVSKYSLENCINLKKLVLSEGVTIVEEGALVNCEKLETVSIPESLKTIEISERYGAQNFSGCHSLQMINVADGNQEFSSEDGVLYDKNKTTLIAYPAGAGFSYSVPEGVTHIEACAFMESNIAEIKLPSTIESIGNRAFYDCENLVEVVVPKNANGTSIGSKAFCNYGIHGLEAVILPMTVTKIDEGAFGWSDNLTIYGEGGIAQNYAEENGITYMDISEYVPKEEITGEGWSLKNGILTISSNVEHSEWEKYDEQITIIRVLEGVTVIPDYAFSGPEATVVILPESLEVIGRYALPRSYNYKLKSVYIGKNVREIGENAFGGNTAAEVSSDNPYFMSENRALYTKDKTRLLSIGADYTITSYTLPKTVTQIDADVLTGSGGEYFTEILVEDGNTTYCSVDGVLCNKDKTVVVAYPCGRNEAEYVMPETVTAVGDDAFCSADLTSITFSSSLREIGNGAFRDCDALTGRITLPVGVKTIGVSAFGFCNKLTAIDLPAGLLSIEGYAFEDCEGIEEIIVPRSVSTIGNGAFSYCTSLKSITLSAGMKNLEEETIYDCAALEKLVIPSSITEIDPYAIIDCPNVTIYSAEGSAAQVFAEANSIPFVAIEEDEPQITAAVEETADGVITVSVEAENTEGTVMFAVGYSEGKPVDYEVVDGTTAKLSGEGVSVVKVFCWESLESMKPLCPAKTVEVK